MGLQIPLDVNDPDFDEKMRKRIVFQERCYMILAVGIALSIVLALMVAWSMR